MRTITSDPYRPSRVVLLFSLYTLLVVAGSGLLIAGVIFFLNHLNAAYVKTFPDRFYNVTVYSPTGQILKQYNREMNVQVFRGDTTFYHDGKEVDITAPTLVEEVK